MSRILMGTALTVALLTNVAPAWAADANSDAEITLLKQQVQMLQDRLNHLEEKQQEAAIAPLPVAAPAPVAEAAPSGPQSNDNAFNPAISAVLNGHYAAFTGHQPTIAGFAAGEEGGRATEGLALDEAEIGLSSNVDDKFFANVIASLSEQNGETEVELEEAYIRTIGLPYGLGVKAGRFLTPVGYLNEHHAHTDDFADRPLPSRLFLNNSYKDDGLMASWILPTDMYSEIGVGGFRGGNFPGGSPDGSDIGSALAYGRIGGDIGDNQSWLLGASALMSKAGSRAGNDDTILFHGDSDLYVASLRYNWAPTGNSQLQDISLQGEYFWRNENGTYDDTNIGTGPSPFDQNQSGWYAQGVYKFAPQWRIGARYSQASAGDTPAALVGTALDSGGHDPWNAALMGDWTNSEFSRVRLQYGYEEPANGQKDNQIILQYIMAIGAHPAHTF